jgi:hypothetical protein
MQSKFYFFKGEYKTNGILFQNVIGNVLNIFLTQEKLILWRVLNM